MTIADSAPRIEWFSHAELAASRGGFAPRDTQPSVSSFAAPPDGPRRATFDVADCDARLRAAGFTTLCYGAFELIGQQMLAAYLLRDFAPASFPRAYVEGRLFEVDPRFAEWRQGVSPIAWRLDELDAHARRTGERRMHALVNSLRAHAMHSGVIFCWPVPHLDLRVAVSLASEAHDGSLDDRVIGCALALSLDVHRAAQPHLDARVGGARTFVLERDEAAVLERLVHGLSDQEIANALSTSLHRVGAQIRTLEKRFNARNRAQLAYLAARRLRG